MLEKKTGVREGTVWVGIGIVMCILALKYDIGSFHGPGPGFVPLLAGLFISAMGVAMTISGVLSKHRPREGTGTGYSFRIGPWPRLVYTMGLLLIYIVLIEPVGFILMTFFLMFGLFFDGTKKNYGWSLFFSIVTALISYLIFEVWLQCQLPRGLLPWW